LRGSESAAHHSGATASAFGAGGGAAVDIAGIIKRCTGELTFGEVIDDLAKTYAAPRDRILADASALLRGLADKKLLEL